LESAPLPQPTFPQQTPLHRIHQALNARIVEFGGWSMPIQYEGITAEHQAVRQKVGMFDISHMGKFRVQGPNVLNALQKLVPSDVSLIQTGQAKYTVMLNAEGGVIDDLIIYNQGKDASGLTSAILIVNASTTEKDKAWLTEHLSAEQVALTDYAEEKVLIAVQGPEAIATLQTLTDTDLSSIPNYWHREIELLNQPAWVARTGYTGEDGFEVMLDTQPGILLWLRLQVLGVRPCGLGARDTLRLEAAMALYGQDVNESITPLEAGLTWLVNLDKPSFIGREALLCQKEQGLTRCLVGLEMQGRHIARHDYEVYAEGQPVGIVTSGTFGPTVEKAIALAYVPPAFSQIGQPLSIQIRGKDCPAIVVKRPFYRRPKSELT
jgi:aminomethyltransferase